MGEPGEGTTRRWHGRSRFQMGRLNHTQPRLSFLACKPSHALFSCHPSSCLTTSPHGPSPSFCPWFFCRFRCPKQFRPPFNPSIFSDRKWLECSGAPNCLGAPNRTRSASVDVRFPLRPGKNFSMPVKRSFSSRLQRDQIDASGPVVVKATGSHTYTDIVGKPGMDRQDNRGSKDSHHRNTG